MQKQVEQEFRVHFDYTQMNDVMILVRQYNCRVVRQEIQLFCDLLLAVPKNWVVEISYKLQEYEERRDFQVAVILSVRVKRFEAYLNLHP